MTSDTKNIVDFDPIARPHHTVSDEINPEFVKDNTPHCGRVTNTIQNDRRRLSTSLQVVSLQPPTSNEIPRTCEGKHSFQDHRQGKESTRISLWPDNRIHLQFGPVCS